MLEVVVKHCMDTRVIVDSRTALCANGFGCSNVSHGPSYVHNTAVEDVVRDALGINMVFTVKGFDNV
jgi:hypothetical protein